MERSFRIYFTSDIHGYFSPLDYASGKPADTGLACCMSGFADDGNSLIIDGGDVLQGSPFTYYLRQSGADGAALCADIMNCAGYDFVTLGNHDFNYGRDFLQRYISRLDARCVCANIQGLTGVERTAVVTLKNGLRVGVAGIVTDHIRIWERPENLAGITVTDPVEAARAALRELREARPDVTVCIYHGGFENDLETGRLLSSTGENRAYELCRELDFDILLSGHQHIPLPVRQLFGTWVCQTPDKARQYIAMNVSVSGAGVSAAGDLRDAGGVPNPEAMALLRGPEETAARWLDTPVGHLDTPLIPGKPIEMAEYGSLIANFFNQVQLEASGADISSTSLANEVKGFSKDVTIRDVTATYVYPNTLDTLLVDRSVLKAALERCAEYFTLGADGKPAVSEAFLKPKVEHYNYDFYAGLEVTMDIRRPVGERVVSMRFRGEELAPDKKLTLCMNNYRSSGTGGYGCFLSCPAVRHQSVEIAELIMDYIMNHGRIHVDRTRWLTVLY